MAQNPYKLNPSYSKVFKNQCQHVLEPTENIFQVAFYNPAGTIGNASWVGNFNGPITANGFYPSNIARCLVPKPFYNSFTAADQRRDFSIATYSINAQGNKLPLLTTKTRRKLDCSQMEQRIPNQFYSGKSLHTH